MPDTNLPRSRLCLGPAPPIGPGLCKILDVNFGDPFPDELWVQLNNCQHVNGTLEGMDDKGVVVLQSLQGGEDRPVFYACRLVAWMHPSEGKERDEGYLKAPVDVPPQGPTPPEVEGQPAPPEVPETPPRRREEGSEET